VLLLVVSTLPVCEVNTRVASFYDRLTYNCSAMSLCAGGSVPLVIQQDGTSRAAGNNLIRWKPQAHEIASANITCSSLTICPRVNVIGKCHTLLQQSKCAAKWPPKHVTLPDLSCCYSTAPDTV